MQDMFELQQKIQQLLIALATSDLHAKAHLCDELLSIIRNNIQKEDIKVQLYQAVAPHFVDLQRKDEFDECIAYVRNYSDYHWKLSACMLQSDWSIRAKDEKSYISAFTEGITIAKENNDKIALAQGRLLRGKGYIRIEKYDEALDDLSHSITLAEENNDYNLKATAKYYIGLVLLKRGLKEIGMEKLREASEIAHEQHCSEIIMHTEVARAKMLLEQGESEKAKEILSGWYNEFWSRL